MSKSWTARIASATALLVAAPVVVAAALAAFALAVSTVWSSAGDGNAVPFLAWGSGAALAVVPLWPLARAAERSGGRGALWITVGALAATAVAFGGSAHIAQVAQPGNPDAGFGSGVLSMLFGATGACMTIITLIRLWPKLRHEGSVIGDSDIPAHR